MERRRRDCVILFVGILLCLITQTYPSPGSRRRDIAVGVILDLDTSLGDMARSCINIGLSDFYTTNISLHFRDSKNDVLAAADAARELIEKEKVHAILGPQNSEQARFIVELGNKSNVPVIWFSPSGPSLLPPRSRFFINSNSTRSLCLQFKAIAAIIEAYGWQCVIPIYEEPEFGNDLIPCLTYALQEMDTRIPYTSPIRQNSSKDYIKKELDKIKDRRTCVFLAHMTVELWSKFVEQAQEEEMMSEGYAWILTQGLSSAVDPEANDVKFYMEGFLGVRPSLIANSSITSITRHKRVSFARKLRKENKAMSLYGLWAYDTITSLAYAVENTRLVNFNGSRFDHRNETGLELRNAIQDTDFTGLSGNFNLGEGQLKPSQFVVYNVENKSDMIIGYWKPEKGLFQYGEQEYGKYKLRDPIWPGNTRERPPKLRIGVPKAHFTEFVNFSEGNPTGFAVDVFKKVVHVLPFNLTYDFKQVDNIFEHPNLSSYEHLLCHTTKNNFDIIIGDITIVVNRTNCVDFTMPYLDSSVSMVVKVMSDSKNGWILLEPFDWVLWLIFCVIFVAATIIVLILEKPKEKKSEKANSGIKTENHDGGSKFEEFVRNPFLIYLSDVLSLKRGTSKWVVIVVMFLLTIAVQVYTSNLTPILSERITAKPSPWKDVQEIKRNNVTVGYQSDSWVKDLLIYEIGLRKDQLKPLISLEKYKEELSKGAKKDGVDAIFDETPYLMLLLSQCSSCKMTGPIYKTGGFSFAFPKNSTLVPSFSDAIFKVTQNVMMFRDMKKNISLPITIDRSEYKSEIEMRGLTKDDFGGLFPIVYSILALFFAISILKAKWFQDKWIPFC